jgi:hypothetical protein
MLRYNSNFHFTDKLIVFIEIFEYVTLYHVILSKFLSETPSKAIWKQRKINDISKKNINRKESLKKYCDY